MCSGRSIKAASESERQDSKASVCAAWKEPQSRAPVENKHNVQSTQGWNTSAGYHQSTSSSHGKEKPRKQNLNGPLTSNKEP